jgi:hypothetical protein
VTLQGAIGRAWMTAVRTCGGRSALPSADDGYAAVDAMVALTILSTTLILAISAASVAARDAAGADEMRRASDLMAYLIDSRGDEPGPTSGRADGFDWSLSIQSPASSTLDLALQTCARSVALTAVSSGRHYELKSGRLCAVKAGA